MTLDASLLGLIVFVDGFGHTQKEVYLVLLDIA
jgi:hypothetical protein